MGLQVQVGGDGPPRLPKRRRLTKTQFLDEVASETVEEFDPSLATSDREILLEDLKELEKDCFAWAAELFPNYVKGDFSKEQRRAWHWAQAVERGRPPGHFGAFWPRGHAKSSTVAMIVIYLAALQKRRYVLIVSETQKQAEKHLRALTRMLESTRIERYYPHLGERATTKFNVFQNWNATRVVTAGGLVIDAVGLDTASRGLRYEDLRPDLIVFDDVDRRHESPMMTRKKEEIITDSILPAGSKDVAVFFAQNIIRDGSIAWKVAYKKADYLVNIERSGPYPGFVGLKVQPSSKYESGYEIVAGTPTWPWFDLEAGQHQLSTFGLAAFMREVQQRFDLETHGYIYRKVYDERIHVITWSEFAEVYGQKAIAPATRHTRERVRIPSDWRIACMQDWGTTDTGRCATLWMARPTEAYPWNDTYFVFRELVVPNPFGFDSLLDDGPDEDMDPADRDLVTANRVGAAIWKAELRDREMNRMDYRVMSHEAKSARNIYRRDLPKIVGHPKAKLNFAPFNTSEGSDRGIDTIVSLFDPLKEENPFRRYPIGHPNAGEPLWGRPRLVYIVADEQGELIYDENQDDGVLVAEGKDSMGLAYTRWETWEYRWAVDALGDLKQRKPHAKDNHAMDALRMGCEWAGPRVLKATAQERVAARVAAEYPHLTDAAIAKRPDEASRIAALHTRAMIEERLQREQSRGVAIEHKATQRRRDGRSRSRRAREEDTRW